MVEVFLLWHTAHADAPDGAEQQHRDEEGEIAINEEDGDNVKLLGVYSTEAAALARIDTARTAPGFADEPDCFMVDVYTVDQDEWTEGFIRLC
jgi:hypothetical protein